MSFATLRRGLVAAAALSALVLASCETPAPPPVVVEPPPPPAPPVMLNSGIADAAASYVAYMREVKTLRGGFADAASIRAALLKGSAYEPAQLSRGMIAYGAVIALQSPEYVAGVRTFAVDAASRRNVIDQIIRDPAYAAQLPGAEMAAGLITTTLNQDIVAITAIADSIEGDAYTIQERQDPRRSWAVVHVTDREARLEQTRALAAVAMLPSAEESARLMTAGNSGTGLGLTSGPKSPPYTPAVVHSLAIAALSALGAGGEEWRPNHLALAVEPNNEFCLTMSKLNLYQCLAASRPHYEDIFCVGRHVVRDLATCAAASVGPPPQPVTVSLPAVTTDSLNAAPSASTAEPYRPATPAPAPARATPAQAPAPTAESGPVPYQPSGATPTPTPTPAPAPASTSSLNSAPPSATDGPEPYQPSGAPAPRAPEAAPPAGAVPPEGVPTTPVTPSDTAVPYSAQPG